MGWLVSHMGWVLYLTGGITASALLVCLAPRRILPLLGLPPRPCLLVRHWGLAVGVLGVGLVWAGRAPAAHQAVIAIALVGKLGFCALAASELRRQLSLPLLLIGLFDLACVAAYACFLLAING